MTQYELVWHSGVFLATCLLILVFGQLMYRLFNLRISVNEEMTDRDNLSFLIGYVSYFVSIVTIIGGVMSSDSSDNFWNDIANTFMYGMVGVIMLNISFLFVRALHPNMKMVDEITARTNLAAGILKGATYLGTGIIISGVLLTEVNKPLEALIFFVFALALALLGYMYYRLIIPFSVVKEIAKGNAAVAISAAGAQISFACLISSGFQIVHTNWKHSVLVIGIDVLLGLILIPLVRFIVDKVFIPKRKITDELIHQEVPNFGIGLFEGAAYVGGALLFVWCWNL